MKNILRKSVCVFAMLLLLIGMITINVMAEEIIETTELEVGQQIADVNDVETEDVQDESSKYLANQKISNDSIVNSSDAVESNQASDEQIQISMTMSEFQEKLNQFRARYPNGSYYDDAFGKNTKLALQCHGYGRLLTQHVFGVECMNGTASGWTRLYDINQVSPGDMIRYLNEGHTVFVTGVSGNIVTYTEANYWPAKYGTNYVRWDVQAPKSYFTGLSYIAHYSANPVVETPADTTPPTISNIQITDINSEGFTVRCNVVNFHIISDWFNHNKTDKKGRNNAKIMAC
jgi:hypothetical protein